MNFSVLAPEVTSAQMYSGAGSGPMLAAAASWAGLGGELGSAANSFSSVTSGLPWQGAAASAMTTVASNYSQWLTAAATQAGAAAAQAKAVAGIFEAAKAAITHPVSIAANRTQWVSLVKSNLLGFNAPAIAAVEGEYESMWARNVAALSGYHGAASAVVARLTPWQQALQALPGPASASGPSPAGGADIIADLTAVAQVDELAFTDLQLVNAAQISAAKTFLNTEIGAAASALGSFKIGQAGRDLVAGIIYGTGTTLTVTNGDIWFLPDLIPLDLMAFGQQLAM